MTNAGIQAAKAAGIGLSRYRTYMFVATDALHLTDPKQFCPSRATIGGTPGRIMIYLAGTGTGIGNLGEIPEHELGSQSWSKSCALLQLWGRDQIGRASCRERV